MSGCCANCQNVRYDSKANAYECHVYPPEVGEDGNGRWPLVSLAWDCRQWLDRLQPLILDKDSHSGTGHPVPDGFPSR